MGSGYILSRASSAETRACDVTQPLTDYPEREEVSQPLTSPYGSFWSSAADQAKVGCTLRCPRTQLGALLTTVLSPQETGLLQRTHVCHETSYGIAEGLHQDS